MVPLPRGISSDQVHSFLQAAAPEVFVLWKQLGNLYSTYVEGYSPFLERPEPAKILLAIENTIKSAFEKAGKEDPIFEKLGLSNDLLEWIQERKDAGHYLMVRSTGAEDSLQTANAGGNVSKSYVIPEREQFCNALGEVAASYFGYASLQNRLNAQENPFKSDLKLAVTAQELIGETIGGSSDEKDIPVSLVLFTNEPFYTGNESFRVMRLSATLGHGEGIVGNQGIACDTALILISQVDPSKLYIVYDNKAKPERLAHILNEQGEVILGKIANPSSLINKPVLTHQQIKDLYLTGITTEKYFENHASDMEIVIKKDQIYAVQARPINRPLLLPTHLDMRKVAELPASPIVEKIQAEMIVPGKASVVIVRNARKVLFARTLEEAEKKYVKGKHQIVLVCKDEPANSHPVVNFSGLGIPCLFLPEGETAEKMLEQIFRHHKLAVCVQTATLNLWDTSKGKIEECVSEGFAVHPAKIIVSLPIEKAPPIAETTTKISQDVKNALLEIRSAVISEVALKKLQEPEAACVRIRH
ncbi:MAG: hypothetical protein H0W50_06390 [Parachlamydiaceae bacterium]|nr:hypothetical protein [Parachlamydiaceae bacterium]